MSDSLPIVSTNTCSHLRSKGMYVTGTMNPEADDPHQMGDGYCWCGQTQGVIGPDDGMVDRSGCNVSRACYQALV